MSLYGTSNCLVSEQCYINKFALLSYESYLNLNLERERGGVGLQYTVGTVYLKQILREQVDAGVYRQETKRILKRFVLFYDDIIFSLNPH